MDEEGLRHFLLPNVRTTGKQLGTGSYGSVEEVEVDGLVCAAKKIHDVILYERYITKFKEECQLMSDLRHPHLVQFLGICLLPPFPHPVLVMEKLHSSLDDLLTQHTRHPPLLPTTDIPLSLKRAFFVDTARGLRFLHHHRPNPVIHRDLSAGNVLLTPSMLAKISDLGNARIMDLQPDQLARARLTRAPGTPMYMPPEALRSPPCYGPALDIFSLGHLMLYTLIQVLPWDILSPTYTESPRGLFRQRRLLARSELKRREHYITQLHQQLGVGHPLVRLVEECLANEAGVRPSAEEVLQQLEQMDIDDPYQNLTRLEMMRMVGQKEEEIRKTVKESQQKDIEIRWKDEELGQMEAEMGRKEHTIQQKEKEILRISEESQQKDKEIERRDEELGQMEAEMGRKEQTIQQKEEEIQRVSEESQQKDREIRRRDEELRQMEAEMGQKEQTIHQEVESLGQEQVAIVHPGGASLKWRQCADLPVRMEHAQAVQLKTKVYVQGDTGSTETCSTIYVYEVPADVWVSMQGPAYWSALAIYNSQLVLVGGVKTTTGRATDQLWVLQDEQTWTQPLRPMPTARDSASAISSGDRHLVVAGGHTVVGYTDSVEVYDGVQWVKAYSLPMTCSGIKSTYHLGMWYLMGGKGQSTSVLYTSLQSLIEKATQQPPHSPDSSEQQSVWKTLPDVPYEYSSTTTLGGALFTVGGRDSKGRTSSINMYSPLNRSWLHVSNMPRPVRSTCSVTLTTGEMMVIGGFGLGVTVHKVCLKLK